MKVYCINFQEVAEGHRTNALVQAMFNMFRRLYPEKYIFLNSSLDKDYGPNFHCLNKYQLFFYKVFNAVSIRVRIPSYIRRTLQEKIVDYCLCNYLKKEKEPFLLITTMYAVRSTKYAKKKGNKVVLWAGNLNDNLYYETVKKEQKRLGLQYTDVYSSDYRIGVYQKMFENIDYVWCPNKLAVWSFGDKRTIANPRKKMNVGVRTPKNYKGIIPDKIRIGYFGHTTLLKGVHLLPEATSICKHKNNIEFVIAGSVDSYVKEILDRYDITIHYLGPIPEVDKTATIQSFDYMIVPSLYDAGPMTIQEAIWNDVPVIVSSGCGGLEWVIDNPQCIVFETMNIKDLADKLDYAFEHRAEYLHPGILEKIETDNSMSTGNLDFFYQFIEQVCDL